MKQSQPLSTISITEAFRLYKAAQAASEGTEAIRALAVRHLVACIETRPFHALRGSALSIMAEHGLAPHELAAIAGHASVATTYRHYVRARRALLDKARLAGFTGRYRT